MKKELSIFFCLCAFSLAGASSVRPYSEALEEVKESGKDILVLCVGSGWMKDSERLVKGFKQVASRCKRQDLVWAVYDLKRELDDKGREALGTLPLEIYGYPAWIYMDAKSRALWHKESIELKDLLKLPLYADRLAPKRKKRDAELKKVIAWDGIEGMEKAEIIGRALDPILTPIIEHFPFQVVSKYIGSYRDLIDRMKAFDPTDRHGYLFKFTFNYLPIVEGTILKNCNGKKFRENYRFLDEKLALGILTPTQRQRLMAFKFTTALRENKLEKGIGYLDEAIALAPKSAFAADCKRVKKYYTQPVILKELRWNPEDNRPRWTQMIVEITPEVKDYGSYTLEFKHEAGHTKFRNPAIKVGRRTVAEMEGERTTFTFSMKDVPDDRVYLSVESLGTGWFSGCGDILIRKKP